MRRHSFRFLVQLLPVFFTARLFASAGDLFVAIIDEVSPNAGAVVRISRDGTKHSFASPIADPYGVVFDRDLQLLVTSDPANSIFKYSLESAKSTFATDTSGPIGLARDSAGTVYCASIRGNAILKFSPAGNKTILASGIARPIGVAVDAAGNVYTGGFDSGIITKISPSGTKTTFATGLARPYGLVFDSAGNLLVAERAAGIISKITPAGAKSTFLAGLTAPFGLVFDTESNLYISEHDASQITKVTPEGVRSVFATDLKSPAFMAFEPATGNPVNISSRVRVETGDNVMIGGFILSGNAAKRVAVRAIGPSLSAAGVNDSLQDPLLELHDQTGAVIASNDNWRSSQAAELQQANLAPADDRESALVMALLPGAYTAIVRGAANSSGVGLVEVYDLEAAADSRLANISTRGFVGTGDNVMIGGFIVQGNGSRVVARAIGPSLTEAGVANALADPGLTLFNSNGSAIASNDNWQETQQTALTDAGLAPRNDLESALVATLPNGAYTAIVSGKNLTSGVGLVEVYALP